MYCSNCGKKVIDGQNFCDNCGKKLNEDSSLGIESGENIFKEKYDYNKKIKKCRKCNKEINNNANYCPECQSRVILDIFVRLIGVAIAIVGITGLVKNAFLIGLNW